MGQSMPTNQLVLPQKKCTISFCWQGDSVLSEWEAHSAILIPVRLEHCSRKFYMQFDLGSPYSLLYKNKIDAIKTKYPNSIQMAETGGYLKNFSFKAGQVPVVAKEIVVKQFDTSVINWKDKNGIEIIGTIGADLIDDKVVTIDYPGNRLIISQTIPGRYIQHVSMFDFVYSNRRVLLPAQVAGKETILFFDTGSSMFELLTDKETCMRLALPDTKPVQYAVNSWNKFLTANTLASNNTITIANTSIPIHSTTYIEGVSDSQIELMSKMGIGGMTGNKLFINHILVLDTKNHKFGIIETKAMQYSEKGN